MVNVKQQTALSSPLVKIHSEKTGMTAYTKVSFPVHYGRYSEIETREFHLLFNRNHEIRHAKSKSSDWTDPSEWMKRTAANDWIYYSTGGYAGVFESIGEYYLPNLNYPTNGLLGGKPFDRPEVSEVVNHWHPLLLDLFYTHPDLEHQYPELIRGIRKNTPEHLELKANMLFDLLGRRLTVLPPDARHVDYDLIPLNISDGCLYKCRFCAVKNPVPFAARPMSGIKTQVERLKRLYGQDLINYNSLFLGEHDALNCPDDLILHAAQHAFDTLELDRSIMQGRNLFLFGSTGSFLEKLKSGDCFFQRLKSLNCMTYINLGLESADQQTLDDIGKSFGEKDVCHAFEQMQQINARMPHVEITCNFLFGEDLRDDHYNKMLALIRDGARFTQPKGSVYLSPVEFDAPAREKLFFFNRIKTLSRFPTFLYIIQRL